MAQPITYKGTVYPWHCDHMGHMNVMWYTGKMDEASWQLFSSLGLTPAYLKSSGRGMAALEINTRYLAELVAGDVVSVRTRVTEILKDKIIKFSHELMRDTDGTVAAISELTAIHMDTAARRSCAFEQRIRESITNLITQHKAAT
ncbi:MULTISPECIES: acyl-CoA thioesterase [Kordiimonas]|jgi:acyl-CoA thioester hydrolase|uniref:acyl-CoA thioesterase n=1 Tax=Kordiimonas TaxID=288021 RepID=UPI00257F5F32|nr:thioesterase family protein [Kordiimonas sp. UBA4487]